MGLASVWVYLVFVLLLGKARASYYSCGTQVAGIPAQPNCSAIGELLSTVFVTDAYLCTQAICFALLSSNGCNCWLGGGTQGLLGISSRWHAGNSTIAPDGSGMWQCPGPGSNDWFDPQRNAKCGYVAYVLRSHSWGDWGAGFEDCNTNPVGVTGCACPGYFTTTTSSAAATTTSTASTSVAASATTTAATTAAASTTATLSSAVALSTGAAAASTAAATTTTEVASNTARSTVLATTAAASTSYAAYTTGVESTLSTTTTEVATSTAASTTSTAAATVTASLTTSIATASLIDGPLPSTGSQSVTAATGGSAPPAPSGQLIVVIDMGFNTSWSAPPVIIYDGGAITVNGTAYINGTIAQVHVGDQGPETKRVPLIHASEIVGRFANVDVLYEEQRMKSGKCRQYFVSAQDKIGGDLSVLVASREAPCASDNPKAWVITGIVAGVLGVLLLILGLLFLVRDAAQRWVRGLPPNEEDALSLTSL